MNDRVTSCLPFDCRLPGVVLPVNIGDCLCRCSRDQAPGRIEVVTFGIDHPGATVSGARAFYERFGFATAEAAAAGPEGGSR
ncbi:hypothetical protein [Nocardia aurea]|uniref:hypothetical protein n=1 Tax=Nocardia aurea TaxID=2144174 RepID=UPI0033ADC76B